MKILKCLPVLLLFAIGGAQYAVASGAKAVIITNNTPYTLSELYASGSDSSSWDTSNNLLGGQSLAPAQATTVTIADGLAACNYDLMAILYGSAEHAYRYQIDACNGGSWSVH
jgi:hypothetical protein